MKKIDYKELLYKRLEDGEYAAAYLAEVLENESYSTFLVALKDVVEARTDGISSLADDTGLARQTLHKVMSADGNPRLSTLNELLKALGLKISVSSFVSKEDKEAA